MCGHDNGFCRGVRGSDRRVNTPVWFAVVASLLYNVLGGHGLRWGQDEVWRRWYVRSEGPQIVGAVSGAGFSGGNRCPGGRSSPWYSGIGAEDGGAPEDVTSISQTIESQLVKMLPSG